jgi:hypothetical protein
VLGNEGLRPPGRGVFKRAIEVSFRNGPVGQWRRWEQVFGIAVLDDQALADNPQNLGPNLANGVDTPVPRLVKRLVRGRVDGLVLRGERGGVSNQTELWRKKAGIQENRDNF